MKVVSESNREPKKLQPDQETKFYNRLMQVGLDINNVLKNKSYKKCQLW